LRVSTSLASPYGQTIEQIANDAVERRLRFDDQ
jgi:hypothetical protein